MKKIYSLLLLTSIFCSTTQPAQPQLTPKKTGLALDIDGVVLKLSKCSVAYKSMGLIENTQDALDLFKTLWHMSGIKKIRDENGNKIEGLTPQMITLGMHHKEATRFIVPMLDVIEDSRHRDEEIIKIIQESNISEKVLTTNKDFYTYLRAVKKHNLDEITDRAIVTKYPLSPKVIEYALHPDTDEKYRQLVIDYNNAVETDKIKIALEKKPSLKYYALVETIIGPEKNILHLDDTKKNIDAFNTLNTELAQRIGVHYQGDPEQLQKLFTELGLRK